MASPQVASPQERLHRRVAELLDPKATVTDMDRTEYQGSAVCTVSISHFLFDHPLRIAVTEKGIDATNISKLIYDKAPYILKDEILGGYTKAKLIHKQLDLIYGEID